VGLGHVNINVAWVGLDVKYYFDTKDLAAPISFANPYVLAGVGSYTKTQTTLEASGSSAPLNSLSSGGLTVGGGLEFALKPKRCYFTVEGKAHFVGWDDDADNTFNREKGIQDISGPLFSVIAGLLFTW
jgi:hypothetical protein